MAKMRWTDLMTECYKTQNCKDCIYNDYCKSVQVLKSASLRTVKVCIIEYIRENGVPPFIQERNSIKED